MIYEFIVVLKQLRIQICENTEFWPSFIYGVFVAAVALFLLLLR